MNYAESRLRNKRETNLLLTNYYYYSSHYYVLLSVNQILRVGFAFLSLYCDPLTLSIDTDFLMMDHHDGLITSV